jgi:2-polyprenyl-3-methyl-5-hydroxy-6-metoxy-1,4-benzoquinol methylase
LSRNPYDLEVRSIVRAGTAAVDVPACPVCGLSHAEPRFTIEGMTAQVVVCPGCGLGRIHPQPSAEEIGGFYSQAYYGETGAKFEPLVEALVRLVAARRARFFARGLPRGARVLEIGCGRGVLLKALADRGFEVHGVDLSERAVEGVDPRVQLRFASRLGDAGYSAACFDRVILWHVLEHLPDPQQTLDEVRRILRPGGALIVAVPNFSSLQARWAGAAWFHLDLPRHLFHFPLPALRSLLQQRGFVCRSEHHFSLRQNPFGWVQSGLNRLRWLPRNGLYVLLHRKSRGVALPFDRLTRLQLRAAYWLGMPLGLLLSIAEAAMRSGATVHLVATSEAEAAPELPPLGDYLTADAV